MFISKPFSTNCFFIVHVPVLLNGDWAMLVFVKSTDASKQTSLALSYRVAWQTTGNAQSLYTLERGICLNSVYHPQSCLMLVGSQTNGDCSVGRNPQIGRRIIVMTLPAHLPISVVVPGKNYRGPLSLSLPPPIFFV